MTAKAARNRRSKTDVSLTFAAVAAQATGTPSPSAAMCLGSLLGPVGGVRAGEVATTLGANGTGVEDQVGMAAQHADQLRVHLRQQARLGPARQEPAQGRAAGLVLGGDQAAPGRALAQEAAQRRHDPDGLGRWMARSAARLLITGVDHGGDEMQGPGIQCRCPRLPAQTLPAQTWAAAALERKSGPLNRQWL